MTRKSGIYDDLFKTVCGYPKVVGSIGKFFSSVQFIKKPLELNGETVEAMVYIMNGDTPLEAPTEQYYGIIKQGYKENGLDTRYLETAFEEAVLAENMEFESKFGMEIF